jgi:hypothetical protein
MSRHTIAAVALLIGLSAGCATGDDSGKVPGATTPPGPTPVGNDIRLTVAANLEDAASRTYSFVGEIVGATNDESLYCQAVTWGFGDAPPLTVTPSCAPWTPSSTVQTRYTNRHTYSAPGTYVVTFGYGSRDQIAQTTIEVK